VNSAELKKAKKEVRRRVLELRDALTAEERAAKAEAVAARCLDLPEVTSAGVVMAFWTFGSELPTMPLIEALLAGSHEVALPRIVDGNLQVRTWRPGEPMTPTRFGALEPSGGRTVPANQVGAVLTPAVAFDRSGHRVGYGGGFYDRFFPKTDADRIGVGFSLQVVAEDLPGGGFDLPVHVVVTEDEVIRPRLEQRFKDGV
jgi:5-formyltetrahydrofolate cyclo-ligase